MSLTFYDAIKFRVALAIVHHGIMKFRRALKPHAGRPWNSYPGLVLDGKTKRPRVGFYISSSRVAKTIFSIDATRARENRVRRRQTFPRRRKMLTINFRLWFYSASKSHIVQLGAALRFTLIPPLCFRATRRAISCGLHDKGQLCLRLGYSVVFSDVLLSREW